MPVQYPIGDPPSGPDSPHHMAAGHPSDPRPPLRRLGVRWHLDPPAVAAAVAGTCLALIVGAVTLYSYHRLYHPTKLTIDPQATMFWGKYRINAYLLQAFGYYDGKGQRLAHQAMVFLLGAIVLLCPMIRHLLVPFRRASSQLIVYALAAGCGVTLLYLGRRERWGVATAFGIGISFAGAAAAMMFAAWGRRLSRGHGQRYAMMATLALLAVATLPAAFTRPDLSGAAPDQLAFLQLHFSVVLGGGDRLAAGQHLLRDVIPYYGLFFIAASGAYQRHVHPLSMADHIHLLQFSNTLYLAATVYLYYRYGRRRWILCLLPFILVVPWYFYASLGVAYPNNAAVRTFGFPIVLLLMYWVRQSRPSRAAFVLGCGSGAALLFNIESGVAATAASLAFLYFRYLTPPLRNMPTSLGCGALFAAGLGVALLGFVLACAVLLRPLPDVRSLFQAWTWLKFWSVASFGSLPMSAQAFPLLMFFHAAFVLVHVAIERRSGPAGFRASFRAAAATMILVWFAYYFNRPISSNTSSFCLPYGLLLIDSLRSLMNYDVRRRGLSGMSVATFAALALLVFPRIIGAPRPILTMRNVDFHLSFGKPVHPSAMLVQGIYLPREAGERMVKQAAFIREVAARGRPTIYFAANTYLIPKLSGVCPDIPYLDVPSEVVAEDHYRTLIDRCIRPEVSAIYFDSPNAAPRATYLNLYDRLRVDLSPYFEQSSTEEGWEVWQRRR